MPYDDPSTASKPAQTIEITNPQYAEFIAMATPLQSSSLCLDFPLRPDYLAQIVVPRNLTAMEAKRLSAFIQTLALPEPTTV